MEKARDKFVIGQYVEILVRNSHHGEIGKIVAFDERNEYNVKVAFEDEYIQGYMTNDLRPIPRLGQKLSIVDRIKRAYYRWRNSDPVKKCPVYLNEGCAHVDGMLCNFPDCRTYHKRMGHEFVYCPSCRFIDECGSNQFGLGCYDGEELPNNLIIT